ncbi:CopD family protein [Amycolatopsis cynarae]|uniref:CopD family protein n=1 Tax=Amycolatopsis cynarae TaxID=2995223 RepID=A0ABY7B0F4_9PSEU|nr:CopD family protein [Amycolatopsis sp. HUAS 11-8]WAL65435.1 CopD family protein [Amycolatopsis sp. HUAS 11-8]
MVLKKMVLGALVALAVLANPAPASAHVVLLGTTPGDYEVVPGSPHELTMRFNEPIDAGLAEVRLIGPRGDDIEGIGKPRHPGGQENALAVDVPNTLANGTYTVAYRVVSADSHAVPGAFGFSVGEPSATSGAAAAAASGGTGPAAVSYGVARWLGFAGLALLVGTALFVAVCWPGGATRTGIRKLLRMGWTALVVSTVATVLVYGAYATGRPMTDFGTIGDTLTSRIGVLLLVRTVMLGLIAAGLPRFLRGLPAEGRGRHIALVCAAAVALAVTWSLATHSAAGSEVALALPADVVHLTAMSAWIGGLPVLLGVLLRSGDLIGIRLAVPRFSRIAVIAVALLVVTGTYQAWRQVGGPSALFGTTYGGVLLAKLGVVVVLVALGALARQWVRRHYSFDIRTVTDKRRARRGPGDAELGRFRRTVAVEVVLGAVVLGLTASLVGIEPARAEQSRLAQRITPPERTGPVNVLLPFDAGNGAAGRGQVAVSVLPGRVGTNQIHISVLDAQRAPKEIPEVRAELRLPERGLGPLPVTLENGGQGHYLADQAVLTMPGRWELTLFLRTSEVDQAVVRIPVGAR